MFLFLGASSLPEGRPLNRTLHMSSNAERNCLIFLFQSIFRMIPKDEICKLPSDENTADKRAEKLWRFFKKSEKGEKFITSYLFRVRQQLAGPEGRLLHFCFFSSVCPDRVTESEFIQGVLENEAALRLIQYQPLK